MSAEKDQRPKVVYGIRDQASHPPRSAEGFDVAKSIAADPAPISYRAFPTLLSDQQAAPTPAIKTFAPTETEKRAVWIVHGMGQQIPFATLDSLTEGILSVATLPSGATQFNPVACSIRVGDEVLQRVELKVRSQDNTRDIELHLYEAYWAPLTEGVAKLTDVVGFLVNGALRGILNSGKPFKRAMFSSICEFKIRKRVPLYISAVLLILASLAVINAVILAASGSQMQLAGLNIKVLNDGWTILSAIASAMCAVGITLGVILFLAETCKSRFGTGFRPKLLSWVSWTGTIITMFGIVLTAVLFVFAIWPDGRREWFLELPASHLQFYSTKIILEALVLVAVALTFRAKKRSEAAQTAQSGFLLAVLFLALALHVAAIANLAASLLFPHAAWPQTFVGTGAFTTLLSGSWWVWPFLIFLSAQVRTIMVQYVGDVAIYVTSNKIDRFTSVRKKIKDTAYKSASAVFHALAEDGNHFAYEHIAVVGHSLGSVIAYDTLDQLLNEDRMTGGKMRIAERTCLLETFGSPLNKIAFFFTIQGSDSYQIREQLAESVQPLIMDYKYRPFPWINVHSSNDIISGDVYLYDWPVPKSNVAFAPAGATTPPNYRPAIDQIDPDASVALTAHVDYWKNRLIWQNLYNHIAP